MTGCGGAGGWRSLTPDQLERAYTPSSMVPSIDPFLEAYAARSAEARAAVPHERLAYGSHPDEWVWYARPPVEGGPLHVFVHGGYWRRLSADDGTFAAATLWEAGAGSASVNYSLAPGASLRAITAQAGAALAWLVSGTPGLAHDPARVVVSGHSAGAHLAALAVGSVPVAAAVFVSGVFDLEPVRRTSVDEPLGLSDGDVADLSPICHVARTTVPAVVAWAERDTDEFRRQSLAYASAWAEAGNRPPAALEVQDRNHFDVVFDLGDPATALGAMVWRRLGLA
jgi:arylformamidase